MFLFLKINTHIFSLFYILAIVGLAGLLLAGNDKVSVQALEDMRIEQLQAVELESNRAIQVQDEMDGFVLSDYFDRNEAGYAYQGGLYGAPWQLGHTYTRDELDFSKVEKPENPSIFSLKLGEDNIYMNIDQGGDESVKEFLRTLDQHSDTGLDTMFLDFRFLRSMDFSAIIRLFNQISPPHKIKLGTVLGSYQDQDINSSGRPFFRANHYVVISDHKLPTPVQSIISSLVQYPDYTLSGNLADLPDTVCLYTDYRIESNLYRICTERWTAHVREPERKDDVELVSDSIRATLKHRMDVYWYKERDSLALNEFVPEMLKTLLP